MADDANTPTGENKGTETSTQQEPTKPAEKPTSGFVGSSTGQPLTSGSEPEKTDDNQGTEQSGNPKVIGRGGQEMSEEAISQRVERSIRSKFRALMGREATEEEVKQVIQKGLNAPNLTKEDVANYERLKRAEEARKRARQTQEERTNSELKKKDEELAALRQQLKERDERALVERQDASINEAAGQYVDTAYLNYARRDFAEAMVKLSKEDPEQFKKYGQKQVQRWFEKWAKEHPALAKAAESQESQKPTGEQPQERKVVQRPITTTKSAARPPASSSVDAPGMYKGKTVKPGLPNSMNKQELAEYMRSQGLKPL